MNKTLNFSVQIEFDNAITNEDQIKEVADNIASAIRDGVNSYKGIAPQDGEAITDIIRVTPAFISYTAIEHVL